MDDPGIKAVADACQILGGKSKMARALNTTPQVIQMWINRGRGIPLERCVRVEQLTGVRCEELRPDLSSFFGYLRGAPCNSDESGKNAPMSLAEWHETADRLKKCMDYSPSIFDRGEFANLLSDHLHTQPMRTPDAHKED